MIFLNGLKIITRNLCLQAVALLLCLPLSLRAQTGFSQEPTAAPATPSVNGNPSALTATSGNKKEKKTSLNFEDELVEGQASKPELFYLFQKKNFNYKRLIRLRENFIPEMRKTSEDIQRTRSTN